MQARKRSLKEKLPEIERTLAAVEFLQSRKVRRSEPRHMADMGYRLTVHSCSLLRVTGRTRRSRS